MARRYQSSLANIQGPGAVSPQAGTQHSLAETLQSFRRTVGSIAVRRNERRGATAGAQTEGTPTLRSNATAFGRAYNNAALRNYVISQYADMETELGRLETEAGSSPDQFRQLADGARRGAVQAALPDARADITEIYQRRITEGLLRIEGRRATEQKQLNRAMLDQGLETVSDSISRKVTSGDPLLMAQAEEEELQYRLMVDGALASGDITPAEAVVLRDGASKRITRQVVVGQFERQLREGDPIGFIGSVMAQPVENLSDEEKGEVVGELFQRLNRWQSLVAEEAQLETSEQKARWADGERQATVAVLRRQMGVNELTNMVDRDELDPAVGRTLANDLTSPTRSVDDEALKFQVETNLLAYEEADIAGMGDLSHATRSDLILKRRDEAEGWRNDPGAQEALRRIDVALGIPAGLGPQFQISIGPDDAKAAASARSYFYDLVEATPEEERKAKYFDLADQAITQMRTGLVQTDLAKARASLQQYQTAVGSPADLNERERKEYDETLKRYTDQIAKLEADLGR